MLKEQELPEIESLCATARWCYARGWVPATSGNFSVRLGDRILITPSGLDKGQLAPEMLLEVDTDGRALDGVSRPSAETGLHAVVYRRQPQAHAILHVHTIWNTLLSARFAPRGYVPIEGYELLKAFAGNQTHETAVDVKVFPNTQDMPALAADVEKLLDAGPCWGYLIDGHGLYAWGKDMAEARRHLEAFDFLLACELDLWNLRR